MKNAERLRTFIHAMTLCVQRAPDDEAAQMTCAARLLTDLVAVDDWLPEACAQPHPQHYRQYLLHCDPLERFSLVSFVWGPGQSTPVHDHTVWGLIGMLRGAEVSQRYATGDEVGPMRMLGESRLEAGQVEAVSPTLGDIHRVANAFDDRVSLSIHVYGANIGAVQRHVFDPLTGRAKGFVSGYANATLPNPWEGAPA